MFQRLLDDASNRPPRSMSRRVNRNRTGSNGGGPREAAGTLARRTANKELLSAGELREAHGIAQAKIDDAVEDNRLFAFVGSDGEFYYPAFYAAADLDTSGLELVAQKLNDHPGASRFHFFVSKRTNLSATPLEALQRARLAKVLSATNRFAVT
jgi:hypothetical protein